MRTLKALFRALEVQQQEMKTRFATEDAIKDAIKVVAVDTAYQYINRPKKPKTGNKYELNENEKDFAAAGRKIDAIKSYRARTGLGLLESKQAVEAWQDANKTW